MPTPAEHIKAGLDHPYQKDTCFLCARDLGVADRTEEHVIPRWLQDDFNLWDKHLVLLNGTSIPYRQVTIPCCFECNNRLLAPLENRVRGAVTSGYNAVHELPRFDLFRWLAKIFVGLQFREMFLSFDRSSPDLGTIVKPAFLRRCAILHFWLQLSCTNETTYSPGSVWVFPAQVPTDSELQFDLRDDAAYGVIAMRLRGVVIIADFLENGLHEKLTREYFAKLATTPLHPRQFDELVAMIIYGARRLRQRTEVEFASVDGRLSCAFKWSATTISGSAMDPWVQADYAHVLSAVTGIPLDHLYLPPNTVMSWLRNPAGELVYWELGTPHPFAGASGVRAGP
jgi:hypothetical protein